MMSLHFSGAAGVGLDILSQSGERQKFNWREKWRALASNREIEQSSLSKGLNCEARCNRRFCDAMSHYRRVVKHMHEPTTDDSEDEVGDGSDEMQQRRMPKTINVEGKENSKHEGT